MFLYYLFFLTFLNFITRMVIKEIYQLSRNGFSQHFDDFWNILDMIFIITAFCLPFGWIIEKNYNMFIPTLKITVFMITLLCICVKYLQLYEAFPYIGTKTYVLFEMLKNIRVFWALILVFGLPYGILMCVIYDLPPNKNDL